MRKVFLEQDSNRQPMVLNAMKSVQIIKELSFDDVRDKGKIGNIKNPGKARGAGAIIATLTKFLRKHWKLFQKIVWKYV